MNSTTGPHLNLLMAWVWILGGFVSGMALGMGFHKEGWLGGYGGFRRRLYRLGHISFFGLGTVNLLFYLTFRDVELTASLLVASRCLVLGALTMPLCCALLAHFPRLHLLFSIPVLSLLAGGTLVVAALTQGPIHKSHAPPGSPIAIATDANANTPTPNPSRP